MRTSEKILATPLQALLLLVHKCYSRIPMLRFSQFENIYKENYEMFGYLNQFSYVLDSLSSRYCVTKHRARSFGLIPE